MRRINVVVQLPTLDLTSATTTESSTVAVPSFFLCPISLELMTDPVTLSTGQTYERCSIEQWLDAGHSTCPVTRLPISADEELIPNHTLRRMIQSWCEKHRSLGVERIVTPRQPSAGPTDVPRLVQRLDSPKSLHRLTSLALHRPRLIRQSIAQARALPKISSALSKSLRLRNYFADSESQSQLSESNDKLSGTEECLKLLATLIITDEQLADPNSLLPSTQKDPIWEPGTIEEACGLARVIAISISKETRNNALIVLSRTKLNDFMQLEIATVNGFMNRVLEVIKEGIEQFKLISTESTLINMESTHDETDPLKLTNAAISVLLQVCASNMNSKSRVIAHKAGAVDILAQVLNLSGRIEILRPSIEMALKALECLCRFADGRDAINKIMPSVIRHLTSISDRATKYSIRIVYLLLKGKPSLAQVAFENGTFRKAMAVAQTAPSLKTRTYALRISKALSPFVPSFNYSGHYV